MDYLAGQHTCFSRSGAGDYQRRSVDEYNGVALLLVQVAEILFHILCKISKKALNGKASRMSARIDV